MKFVRYGSPGQEKPGCLDGQGRLRALSGHANDLSGALLDPERLARLAAIDPGTLPLVEGRPRLGPPVGGIGAIYGIGLNYRDHAAEAGMPLPAEPIVFNKAVSSLAGPNDPLTLPRESEKSDWEVELAVIIGRRARYVPEAEALAHVAGYAVFNDLSERAFQLERGGQWVKGKSADGFAPLGPWLVTPDEVPDPQKLDLWLELNGQRMQTGNTAAMVFGVAHLIAYLSRFLTLTPGDVIATGTPPGVGMGKKPPMFLKPGDVMRLGVAGLGEQRQEVRAP